MSKSETLVIKVGTSVLTRPNQQLDYNVIHQIVEQVGQLRRARHRVVLVSSGAAGASYGLGDFKKERDQVQRLQMMASVGQPRLIAIYNDFFREHRITCAQALLTRSDFGDRERYLSIRNVLEGLLRLNILPIINENDVVASDALTFGDNDFLSAAVASLVGADKLFLLTSTDGFYQGGDPNVNKKARLVDEVQEITPEMWADCQPTLSLGGRGGMYSKLKSAQLASSHGIEVVVASGKEPGVVSRIMEGERLGTRFLPTGKRMRSYRLWLRFGAITNGTIAIDAGAEKALRNNKSLLPAGIVSMEGDFRKGEVVAIHNPAGQQLGMGVVEISSDELRDMISGSREMERSREAVHKDRLLMLQG